MSALMTELASRHERSRPSSVSSPCERWDKRRTHGAFGKQVADEVGNPAGHPERIVRVAGAKVVRHYLLANQARMRLVMVASPKTPAERARRGDPPSLF
jgi:hypothetical protein